MIEIVKAKGRQLKAFFDFSERAGYSKAEAQYLKRCFAVAQSQCVYLLALREGIVCGRLMTWSDSAYNKATGRRQGFFALPDGDEEACEALIREMEGQQRAWGNAEITGPIAPDGSGWFMGQCEKPCQPWERGALTGTGDQGQTKALLSQDYKCETSYIAYALDVPPVNRYEKAARTYSERLRLRLCSYRKLIRALYDLADGSKAQTARQGEKLLQYLARDMTFAVRTVEGAYTGYAIALKGDGLIRIATILTAEGRYRRPTVLLLASALLDKCIERRISRVELSVIDSRNTASNRLAVGLGAREIRKHTVYHKNLT